MIEITPTTRSVEFDISDPVFSYQDGLTWVRRAAIHIDENCPLRYVDLIIHCVQKGYIKPVACMKLTEYVAAKLEQD